MYLSRPEARKCGGWHIGMVASKKRSPSVIIPTFPAERMKMRRAHLVPLAPQAVAVVQAIGKRAGNSRYLFPGHGKLQVMSENTLIFSLYRLGYHGRATVHGFRSTASTILNEAQFPSDWIEMQLAHFDGSVRGVYNAAEWLSSRREMMCWWADHLDGYRKARLSVIDGRGRV
jgi:integrase